MVADIKNRLLELQGERSTEDFARTIGVSRQTMNYWINGTRTPSAENIKTICEKGDISGEKISADWLLGYDVPKTRNPVIQDIADYTGLTEDSIFSLHTMKQEKHGTLKKALSFINRSLPHEIQGHYFTLFSLCEDYVTGTGEAGYTTIGDIKIEKDRLFFAAALHGIQQVLEHFQHECGNVLKTSVETYRPFFSEE